VAVSHVSFRLDCYSSQRPNPLALETASHEPAALALRLQQKKFDRFRQVFNHERPHEGLNNATPGSIYQPSSMTLPRNLIEYVHPKGFELRRVNSGDITRCPSECLFYRSGHCRKSIRIVDEC
jgi:hypothetical protein